jgi:hypothetical protein
MFHFISALGHHIFTFEDPCKNGFKGAVDEGVALDHSWDYARHLGVSAADPTHYRAFRSRKECEAAGFTFLTDKLEVLNEWRAAEGGR